MEKQQATSTEVWVLKRINENESLIGTRKIKRYVQNGGVTEEEEIGEFNGEGLPGMTDEIIPKYNINERKWAWGGTEKQLNDLVKNLGLYDKRGKLIERANRSDYTDPFFTHERFRSSPKIMQKIYTFNNTLEDEFLRLNWAGSEKVLLFGEEDKYSKSLLKSKQYFLILSTNLEMVEKETVDKKIEAFSKLYGMTEDVKNLVAVICQEVYQIGNKDSVITPKLARIAENDNNLTHPQNKLLYDNMKAQEVLIHYADEDLVTLNMAATIVMAINKDYLKYSGDGYKYNGKVVGNGYAKLKDLLEFYKENSSEYDVISANVRLK